MKTLIFWNKCNFGASLFINAWQAMRKKKKSKKKRHLKGLELTRDEQWERINVILVIFAIILLLNTTLILVITWLRISQIAKNNSVVKRRFHFEEKVKGNDMRR